MKRGFRYVPEIGEGVVNIYPDRRGGRRSKVAAFEIGLTATRRASVKKYVEGSYLNEGDYIAVYMFGDGSTSMEHFTVSERPPVPPRVVREVTFT